MNPKTTHHQHALHHTAQPAGSAAAQSGTGVPAPAQPQPTLLLTPLRAAIPAQGGTVELLVRVQAPPQPVAEGAGAAKVRIPLRLALVVDRSGSMDGAPLTEALRCVQHIGERLQPADELAVVLYDHELQLPLPLVRAPGAQRVQQALAGVESGGSTNLFAGWEAGAQQLLRPQPSAATAAQAGGDAAAAAVAISRVVLLSDGQANQGWTDPAVLAGHCRQWLEQHGIGTTTVGLGRGFNEELMQAMASAGGGQQYYGQRAEDLFDAFDEELALLQAMLLRQLRVRPLAAAGVIAEPLGRALVGGLHQGGDGWLGLPDLAWGAEAWTLLRLHVPAQALAGLKPGAPFTALALTLQAVDADGQTQTWHAAPLVLPVMPLSDIAGLPADETVARRLQEIAFAELNLQVRELLQQGRRAQARAALTRAKAQFANHAWLAGKLERLIELAAQDVDMARKEMLYSSGKMRSRLAAQCESALAAEDAANLDLPKYVRRKGVEGQGRGKA